MMILYPVSSRNDLASFLGGALRLAALSYFDLKKSAR